MNKRTYVLELNKARWVFSDRNHLTLVLFGGRAKKNIIEIPKEKPMLELTLRKQRWALRPEDIHKTKEGWVIKARKRIKGINVRWECIVKSLSDNNFELSHRLDANKKFSCDIKFFTWVVLDASQFWKFVTLNGGVVVFNNGCYLSQITGMELDGKYLSAHPVHTPFYRLPYMPSDIEDKYRSPGPEINLLQLYIPGARLGHIEHNYKYYLQTGSCHDINEAKSHLFKHMIKIYNLESFIPQKQVYSFRKMCEKAIVYLTDRRSYDAFGNNKIYFKQSPEHGKGVNPARFSPMPDRYDVGFVGIQPVIAKALLDWYALTGDKKLLRLSERAINGILDFQITQKKDNYCITDKANENYGAFWDEYSRQEKISKWSDFNQEPFVWIWPNARIAYYLLLIYKQTGREDLKSASLLCIEWIISKMNPQGYWDGDRVYTRGEVVGLKNTSHGGEAIRTLTLAYKITGEKQYLTIAKRIASYVIKNFVNTYYTGDVLEDGQQEDVEQGWAIGMIIQGLIYLYRETKDKALYEAAQKAGEWLLTWQLPVTPKWFKTPGKLDITGSIMCEDSRGAYNMATTHETMEACEALLDLYEIDKEDKWLHFAIAGLRAVAVIQTFNGIYSDGAITESFSPSGEYYRWCWSGWQTAEVIHAYTRFMFSIANTVKWAKLNWETLDGKVRGKKYSISHEYMNFFRFKSSGITDYLVLKQIGWKKFILILLNHSDSEFIEVDTPYNLEVEDLLSGEVESRVRRLRLKKLNNWISVGGYLISP